MTIETSKRFTSLKSTRLEEKEVDRVLATPCEMVNNGKKFNSSLDDNNVNNLRSTKAWIRNNIDIKNLEEVDMPKQDGNLSKQKELARKLIIRLEKYEKKESSSISKETRDIIQANLKRLGVQLHILGQK